MFLGRQTISPKTFIIDKKKKKINMRHVYFIGLIKWTVVGFVSVTIQYRQRDILLDKIVPFKLKIKLLNLIFIKITSSTFNQTAV
jgi:hypothetical protein